jgi:putative tricarboxylic transport membrane protein
MSEAPESTSSRSASAGRIKGPQDFYGGLVLMGVALFALWALSGLPGMRGFSFGAGTAPRMFAVLLLLMGAGIALTGLLVKGEPLQRYGVRGLFFVTLAILSFPATIRPFGLVVAAFLSFVIASFGTPEMRWKETLVVGSLLTLGCSLLFPYALGLPLDLYPGVLR